MQGACTLLGLLLLIFLPMVFFSGLNPISELNNVTGASVNFSLRLNDTTVYNLFSITNTASLETLPEIGNSTVYSHLFEQNRIFFQEYQPDQMQIPELNKVAANNWEITPLGVEEVQNYLASLEPTNIKHHKVEIIMVSTFTRPVSLLSLTSSYRQAGRT